VWYTIHLSEITDAYKICPKTSIKLLVILAQMIFGRLRHRWKDSIKMDLKVVWLKGELD
jgi:hypothetical protein